MSVVFKLCYRYYLNIFLNLLLHSCILDCFEYYKNEEYSYFLHNVNIIEYNRGEPLAYDQNNFPIAMYKI